MAHILIVEDQESDAYLMRYAFQKAGLPHGFSHVVDGQEAIYYLDAKPPYQDRNTHPVPDLMLLDLKMPRLTGFDVLEYLQSNPGAGGFPVIILTSSDLAEDVRRARELGASDYRVKPGGLEAMAKLARELHDTWLGNKG